MDAKYAPYLAEAPESVEALDVRDEMTDWRNRLEHTIELLERAALWPARVEEQAERLADVKPLKRAAHGLWNRYLSWNAFLGLEPKWEKGIADIRDTPLLPDGPSLSDIGMLVPGMVLEKLQAECYELLLMALAQTYKMSVSDWKRPAMRLYEDHEAIGKVYDRLKREQDELTSRSVREVYDLNEDEMLWE